MEEKGLRESLYIIMYIVIYGQVVRHVGQVIISWHGFSRILSLTFFFLKLL